MPCLSNGRPSTTPDEQHENPAESIEPSHTICRGMRPGNSCSRFWSNSCSALVADSATIRSVSQPARSKPRGMAATALSERVER
jgi:hypothetical protein